MKIKLLAVLFVLAAFTAKAQQNVVKLNIFSPLVSTLNLSYENAFSEDKSFQIGFFYTGAKIVDTKFTGIGITPEIRFYLGDDAAPQGFYAAPFLRYQNFKLTEPLSSGSATLSTFGLGVTVGKQWIFKEKFSLDLFIGPSYSFGDIKVNDGGSTETFSTGSLGSGFGIRTGLTFGLAF